MGVARWRCCLAGAFHLSVGEEERISRQPATNIETATSNMSQCPGTHLVRTEPKIIVGKPPIRVQATTRRLMSPCCR